MNIVPKAVAAGSSGAVFNLDASALEFCLKP